MNNCLYCRKTIVENRKYCSKKCADNYHYEKSYTQKKCLKCGKDFIGRKNKKYCSDNCSKGNRNKIIKVCVVCKKRFKGSSNQIYCSKSCSDVVYDKNKGVKINRCLVCGGLYRNYDNNHLKTCSPECGANLVNHTKDLILMKSFITTDVEYIKKHYIRR